MKKSIIVAAGFALACFGAVGNAQSAAIIDNGTIQLGVDDFGQLNPTSVLGDPSPVTGTSVVGLRYLPTGNESTSHGCLCEGWGIGIADTSQSGSANNNFGVFNLTPVSFASTASTAISVVTMGDLMVTHDFAPAAETPNLYRVSVTIQNTGLTDIADLRYTRTFDWDVEPTTFNEFVTHGGSAAATAVLSAINNGFVSSDPFAVRASLGASGDFVDFGPLDHGSNFDFSFGALLAGETFSFDIFYGAAGTEAAALAALAAVGAEVFSLGQPSNDPDGLGRPDAFGNPTNTFIFGFAGVGGVPLPPVPVPEPASFLLFGVGLVGLIVARRRRTQ